MRADLGNHRTFCLESKKSTTLVLELLAELRVVSGRGGAGAKKQQDAAKLLSQERERGCETWTLQQPRGCPGLSLQDSALGTRGPRRHL